MIRNDRIQLNERFIKVFKLLEERGDIVKNDRGGRGMGDDEADDAGVVRSEGAGRDIGPIACLIDNLPDATPDVITDASLVIDDPGNGWSRNPGQYGDFFQS